MEGTISPTTGLVVGGTELITVDLRFNKGLLVPQKAGQVNHFDAARKQDQRKLVRITWLSDVEFSIPNGVTYIQGRGITLTLFTMSGAAIIKDMPLQRLCIHPNLFAWRNRPLTFEPFYIDWRRSFVRQVDNIPLTNFAVPFSLDYEPR